MISEIGLIQGSKPRSQARNYAENIAKLEHQCQNYCLEINTLHKQFGIDGQQTRPISTDIHDITVRTPLRHDASFADPLPAPPPAHSLVKLLKHAQKMAKFFKNL